MLSEAGLRRPGVRVSRWQPAQGAVRPEGVVVEQVFRQYPAQMMLAGDQQPAGELAAHGAGYRCAGGVPWGRLRRAADNPAAGRGDDGAAGACELPGAIPDQERDTSSAPAGVHQESARCRRAPPSYDRSPSRPAAQWRVARMLGFDGGTPRPCPRIKTARTEAADTATLPRVLRLPTVNVADLAFKTVAR